MLDELLRTDEETALTDEQVESAAKHSDIERRKKLEYLLDTENSIYTVYRLDFPSGKSYVGVTSKSPKIRWAKGEGYRYNTEMYAEIKEVGWDSVRKTIVETGLTQCEAEQLETRIIVEEGLNDKLKGYNTVRSFTPYLTTGQRVNNYKREHYKRIVLDMRPDEAKLFREYASTHGLNLTEFFRRAANAYIASSHTLDSTDTTAKSPEQSPKFALDKS